LAAVPADDGISLNNVLGRRNTSVWAVVEKAVKSIDSCKKPCQAFFAGFGKFFSPSRANRNFESLGRLGDQDRAE
jgi:hypothetical protein